MHTDDEQETLDRYLSMLRSGLPAGGIDRMIAEVEARLEALGDGAEAASCRAVLAHYRELRVSVREAEERALCILAERMDALSE